MFPFYFHIELVYCIDSKIASNKKIDLMTVFKCLSCQGFLGGGGQV